jgi:hypothetical protein
MAQVLNARIVGRQSAPDRRFSADRTFLAIHSSSDATAHAPT